MERALSGAKTEKFVTGTSQVLKLQQTRPAQQQQQPQNPTTLRSLQYEYEPLGSQGSGNGVMTEAKVTKIKSLRESLLSGIKEGRYGQEELQQKLQEEVIKVVKEIVEEDLERVEELSRKQVTMKAVSLSGALSILSQQNIERTYQQLKQQLGGNQQKLQTLKNVFFDTVIMGGSKDGFLFVKQKIEQGEIESYHIASIFMFLPSYVLTPSTQLLESVLELVKSPQVTKHSAVYNQAVLGLSSLVHKACIAPNRGTSYPTDVYGRFCHPDSQVVVGKVIPFLQEQLQNAQSEEQKQTFLVALGTLGHRSAISTLLPYLEGSVGSGASQSGSSNSQTDRFIALVALTKVGLVNPETIEPMLFAVLNNQGEDTELRVAAFNSLLRLNPSDVYFHRIADLTWREKNQQVLQAINTAFFMLSNQRESEPLQNRYTSMPRKAWLIYPLIKKVEGALPSAATIIRSDYLDFLGTGYLSAGSYYYNQESSGSIPTQGYHRFVSLLNRYQFTPLEVGYRLVNGENLIQQIIEVLTPGESHTTKAQFARQVEENLSSEWKKIIQSLDMKTEGQQNNGAAASLYIEMFEKSPIFHSLKSGNVEEMKQKVNQLLQGKSIKDSICGEHQVNFQRLLDYMPSEAAIPSEMGFPIIVETRNPNVLSLQGRINVQCGSGKLIPSVQVNLRKMKAEQKVNFIGTIVPFTEEIVMTVFDEHQMVNMPINFDVDYDNQQHQLKIKMKALSGIARPVDVVHYHLKPFTVAQKITDLSPMELNPSVKHMRSLKEPETKQLPFGKEMLGLDMKLYMKTESRFTDLRAIFDKLRLYNYNILNLFRFPYASSALSEKKTPSLRMHEYKIIYDPANSPTKEIDVIFKVGAASKVQGEPIKYHQVKKIEGSNQGQQQASYPEWKKLLPIKIESTPIGQGSGHSNRQQKIKMVMERADIEEGTGVHVSVSTIFKGGRQPRSYTYSMTASSGVKNLKQKWDIELASETSGNKICVRGDFEIPNSPTWKIHDLRHSRLNFRYNNVLGYGRDCSESQIKVRGDTNVSDRQKQFSRESPEAKQYEQLKQKNAPITELSEVAEKVRRQASTFDEVDFTVEYVNVPQRAMRMREYIVDGIKAALWPYITVTPPSHPTSSSGSVSASNHWRIRFYPETNTVDLNGNGNNGERIMFKNVRLPNALSYVYPINALDKAIVSQSGPIAKFYPRCQVEGKWLNTYTNETVKHNIDQCFHLVSTDSSFRKAFAVLMRKTSSDEQGPKEMKVLVGKTVIVLSPSDIHSRFSHNVQATVNGTQINVRPGQKSAIKDRQGNFIGELIKTNDNVMKLQLLYSPVMQAPTLIIYFDGQKTKLEVSSLSHKKLAGMCGNPLNAKSSSIGPDQCVYSKQETLAASCRVPSGAEGCSPQGLPENVRRQYEEEKRQCSQPKLVKTKLSHSFGSSQNGGDNQCTRHVHQIIERSSTICFSRRPMTECGQGCRSTQQVQKTASFTCLPKGRTAERYAQKVRQGQVLPELQRLPEAFSVKVEMPQRCVRI